MPLSPVTLAASLHQLSQWLKEDKTRLIFTPNAEIISMAQDNPALKHALVAADLTVPDGIGVIWAARQFGTPLPERVPGIELLEQLLALVSRKNYTVYFLGGRPGVAAEAARRLQLRYENLTVAGFHHGYFDPQAEQQVLAQIAAVKPDILAVALGAPKQELWLTRWAGKLPVKIALGVGGSLDVIAGQVKRAPLIWQRLGLEWLYRMVTDRRRLKRFWHLPRFVGLVYKTKHQAHDLNV